MTIKRFRGCTEFKEKDTIIKDIYKKREEKNIGKNMIIIDIDVLI